jgi:23S rRNA G2445 N2-methylase RlmL
MIDVFRNDCEMFHLAKSGAASKIHPDSPRLVVTNPPWGKRIGASLGSRPASGSRERYDHRQNFDDDVHEEDAFDRDTTMVGDDVTPEEALEQVWNSLGVFLKRECPDSSAFVLSGNPEVSRAIRMRASRKTPIGIGGVDCRLLRYDVLPPKPPGYEPASRRRDEETQY